MTPAANKERDRLLIVIRDLQLALDNTNNELAIVKNLRDELYTENRQYRALFKEMKNASKEGNGVTTLDLPKVQPVSARTRYRSRSRVPVKPKKVDAVQES